MAWELEHPELVGVSDHRTVLHRRTLPSTQKMLLYASLALVPVLLFVVMLLMAKR
jgi:hypothetical protein